MQITDLQIQTQLKILQAHTNRPLQIKKENGRWHLERDGYTIGHHEKKSDFYSSLIMLNEFWRLHDS